MADIITLASYRNTHYPGQTGSTLHTQHGLKVTLIAANQYLHFGDLVVYMTFVGRDLFVVLGTCCMKSKVKCT